MTKTTTLVYAILIASLCSFSSQAQGLLDIGEPSPSDSISKTLLRPKNAVLIGGGSSLVNSDFSDPEFENFLEIGLKRFITNTITIDGNLKKFDIDNFDFKTEGYLSGDLNIGWYIFPDEKFTPIVYAGPGILISNDFDDKNYKVQGGLGLEYLITNTIALIGTLEVNYIYDEQKGSQLLQEADQLYYNASIGVQFYFGKNTNSRKSKSKKESLEGKPSVINSNLIGQYQKFIEILDLE